MIFMHNESGCIFELLILALRDDNDEFFKPDGRRAYRIGEFTLMGDFPGDMRSGSIDTFHNEFTLVGLL